MKKVEHMVARKPIVSLVNSRGHYEGVKDALSLIEEEVAQSIKGKRRILIKPNFVSTRRQLASTEVEAVKAILEVVSKHSSGKIIIGEGPAGGSLDDALRNFGFLKLKDDYDIDFIDFNQDDYVEVEAFDSSLKPLKFRVSKTAVEADYKISVAKPKTHDAAIVTLSVKNMVVGSLVASEKWKIHQGTKAINLNIAQIYKAVSPHLGVVDGFEGMEGRGPVSGEPVNFRVAAASLHPISLDAVVAKAMGFNPLEIGYLYHLTEQGIGTADLDKIQTIGVSPEEAAKEFKPHPTYYEQLKWR